MFVEGSNGHLCVNYFDGVSWKWKDLGAPPGAGGFSPGNRPAVVLFRIHSVNWVYAFVAGANGHLYMNSWNGTDTSSWQDQGTP